MQLQVVFRVFFLLTAIISTTWASPSVQQNVPSTHEFVSSAKPSPVNDTVPSGFFPSLYYVSRCAVSIFLVYVVMKFQQTPDPNSDSVKKIIHFCTQD